MRCPKIKGRLLIMFQRFRNWFSRFMMGRYGTDALNRALCIVSLVFILIGNFGSRLFYWAALVLLGISYFRMLSYNREKRYAENIAYYRATQQVRTRMNQWKKRFSQRRYYHYYRCPRCRQQLRVPRGRGKIEITCPKCRAQFVKKS